ncbi:MAG TPA: GntR family transcriptional regulator [Ruania sp.]|nr:GntR family transcriptional regulator [Ruania sp.]
MNAAALSKSQRAYAWIRERITNQEYKPGYRLVLGSIAAELDMSVVPVREAIRQLEAEGLVTYERNVGARVALVEASQYGDSMQTLSILEATATALAATHITAEDLQRAREYNAQMKAQVDHLDPHEFTELNRNFHGVLTAACPNARLVQLIDAEWGRLNYLRDSIFSFVPERTQESVREHEYLVQLIESGASQNEIETACRHHRAATLSAYLAREHPELLPDLSDF